jgi:hypothetical protein
MTELMQFVVFHGWTLALLEDAGSAFSTNSADDEDAAPMSSAQKIMLAISGATALAARHL